MCYSVGIAFAILISCVLLLSSYIIFIIKLSVTIGLDIYNAISHEDFLSLINKCDTCMLYEF